jgi:signal transduction histidine kinase
MARTRVLRPRPVRPVPYKTILFLAIVALMVALVVHSNYVIGRLNAETEDLCTVLARFFAVSTFKAAEDPDVRPIFREVVRTIQFPLILTDPAGVPRAWKGIDIRPESVPDSVLDAAARGSTVDPVVSRIREIAARFDERHRPIPVIRLGAPGVLGHVHYGEPPLVRQLRWIPYFELGAVVALLGFGLLGYRSIMAGEQRSLWAALAKETAHQIGTPLTSLLGWTALLRERAEAQELEGIAEVASEMERDLERLNKVASRFGQAGSVPTLTEGDLTEVVSGAVDYFRRRLPHLGHAVEIVERYEAVPKVPFHRDLMQWVVENLVRNAIDATSPGGGPIEVSLEWKRERREVELTVRDHGRGMTAAERRRAFEPGFTTKRRGWGLGLALARRVVREYHRGRISIVETAPGRGTVVAVALPVSPA